MRAWATSSSPTSARPTRSARSSGPSTTTTSCTSTARSAPARHRDDQHRADPGRPADAREGHAAPREGGQGQEGRQVVAGQRRRRPGGPRGRHTLFAAGAAAGVDLDAIRELSLLTTKPFLYVFNLDEEGLTDEALKASLAELVAPAEAIFLDAKLETDLAELEPEDAAELLESVGVDEAGLDQLARVGFHTLGLQTYLTAGPKESRAWTIHQGWTAPQAAGVIHTDFQRGFIKAEVVSYDDLVAAGSMAEAKAAGRSASRARTTSWPTATWWSSASTCKRRRSEAQPTPSALRLPAPAPRTSPARAAGGLPRPVLGGRPQVRVGVERRGRLRVPERALDGHDVAPGGDQAGGVEVPQVVQRDAGQAGVAPASCATSSRRCSGAAGRRRAPANSHRLPRCRELDVLGRIVERARRRGRRRAPSRTSASRISIAPPSTRWTWRETCERLAEEVDVAELDRRRPRPAAGRRTRTAR